MKKNYEKKILRYVLRIPVPSGTVPYRYTFSLFYFLFLSRQSMYVHQFDCTVLVQLNGRLQVRFSLSKREREIMGPGVNIT